MFDWLIIFGFALMVFTPCVIAIFSSRQNDEEGVDVEPPVAVNETALVTDPYEGR